METIAVLLVVVGLVLLFGYRRWGWHWYGFVDPRAVRVVLSKHFGYYQGLASDRQREFEQRVIRFVRKKQFIGRGIEITLPMQVLVAAAAVQLTFGLPELVLKHFKRIIIYPDNYYSTITQQYHKGEVNPAAQAIVLSWKNFVEGYAQAEDSLNLGLHEMAHALEIENMVENDEYDFLPPAVWEQWQEQAADYRDQMTRRGSGFFRDYAATNDQEFFAIAIENFFERPVEFQSYAPELYNTLCLLLRQDPSRLA
ncbi:MAG: zinc-dependent peptidase [Tunicatimonas sp.]